MTANEKTAKVFKAFCDANRLTILGLLQNGEKCACKLLEEINIGQSTLSHHMKILCDSGIVIGRKEGKWTHYRLSAPGGEWALERLRAILTPNTEQDDSCPSCGR